MASIKIPFLPWTNDNGLVCGTMPDGTPTFDIYDAQVQPVSLFSGQADEVNLQIAAAMTTAANNYTKLVEALETIAGGHTTQFPGAPDVVNISPAEFRAAMWSWSQKVARAALDNILEEKSV